MARHPSQIPNLVAQYEPYRQASYTGRNHKLVDFSGNGHHGDMGSVKGAMLLGADGLVLPGTSGNYASTPSGDHLNVSDLEIEIKMRLPTITPAANQSIVGRWGNSATSQRSWGVQFMPTGQFRLMLSNDGSAFSNAPTSEAVPFGAGQTVFVRIRRIAASGDISYEWSAD